MPVSHVPAEAVKRAGWLILLEAELLESDPDYGPIRWAVASLLSRAVRSAQTSPQHYDEAAREAIELIRQGAADHALFSLTDMPAELADRQLAEEE